jgi:hypothetical protein
MHGNKVARHSVLKLAVCARVTDSGVMYLHRSVTDLPKVGVVGNAVLPNTAVQGFMAETSFAGPCGPNS